MHISQGLCFPIPILTLSRLINIRIGRQGTAKDRGRQEIKSVIHVVTNVQNVDTPNQSWLVIAKGLQGDLEPLAEEGRKHLQGTGQKNPVTNLQSEQRVLGVQI